MTDAEIIKALECCCKNNNCEGCPLDYLTFSSQCASELAVKSLDLINRQKAEIERLTKETMNMAATIETCQGEAIKEFAERLNEKVENARKKYQRLCKEQGEKEDEAMNIHFKGIIKLINNLVKEIVGERK